jgi:signal transduction histidine kinase
LERLVEDLLTLARGDETRILDSSSTIDVDELVLEEAARTRALPVDRRSVSAGRVVGQGDEMMRVIAHLLDNEARHGRSTIAVGVQTLGQTVQIWVDDDGPGISEEQRERIFERFIRLDDARTRDSGGAGLGLAVAHSTVAHMGGTIKVFDSPLGGARFQIELPAA